MNAATPAEWAEALSLALMLCGTAGGLFFLTVDADPADFDPRPVVRQMVESGRLDPVLIAVVNTRHATHETTARARQVSRNAGITAVALLMLLTAPEATR